MIHVLPSADKSVLRAGLRQARATVAEALPDAAERAAASLPPWALPPHTVVAGYWAKGSEISPLPLMRRLASAGAALALPIAEDRDRPLAFRLWSEGDPLAPDAFGILAPTTSASEARPDLVIAPLLGFDATGARLGQGAGHYDRTLAALRKTGPLFVLGLAYAAQEMTHVPQEAHDEKLDGVLTEQGFRPISVIEEFGV